MLASLTLLWLIQKEEQRLFDLQNAQISQLLDLISQSSQTLQEMVLTNDIVCRRQKDQHGRNSLPQGKTSSRGKLIVKANIA